MCESYCEKGACECMDLVALKGCMRRGEVYKTQGNRKSQENCAKETYQS